MTGQAMVGESVKPARLVPPPTVARFPPALSGCDARWCDRSRHGPDEGRCRGESVGTPQRGRDDGRTCADYRGAVPDNEVMEFPDEGSGRSRTPRTVYDVGREPDPLYTLANERTYLAWLRLAITLLAAAVAIDRLFLERPWYGSELLALVLVAIAGLACALGVRRWWSTELALRLRQPLPGFGAPLLGAAAVVLVGGGVVLLVVTPGG